MRTLVQDNGVPQKIGHIQFGFLGPQDMVRLSHAQIVNRELYHAGPKRVPVPHGVLDTRLGISDKVSTCTTCHRNVSECVGHFGYIKLELPVFHVGYFKTIVTVLNMVCKTCSKILLLPADQKKFLKRFRNPNSDTPQRRAISRIVVGKCKKQASSCPHCGAFNGVVKKVGALKIVHEKYKVKNHEEEVRQFHAQFDDAIKANPEVAAHLAKAQEDLNPLRVLSIFQRISDVDCEIMDLNPIFGRPENLVLSHILVPPVCIRPSVMMDSAQGSNEDDLTIKLAEILHMNEQIALAKRLDTNKGPPPVNLLMENWDFLQLSCAMYINSEVPGLNPAGPNRPSKPIRGLSQRLKGKTGRFRGNLSGKRVDFSSRTVISPDPNLRIDEVAVPVQVATTLTFPERVCEANIDRLRSYVVNGPDVYPGANYIELTGGEKSSLKYGNREKFAAELKIGDIVERHVIDGDVVLFNRQPSLHKLSIMAHRARVMPWRTFRFNECVCTPYNADFDGDEMNLHLPQTEEARAEALVLMGVTNNLITPRNGEPLIAATQDFLTASYVISRRDCFFDRAQFCKLCTFMGDANEKIDLPPPAIIKPIELWSGKQIFSVIMRPSRKSHVLVNLESKSRTYGGKHEHMDPADGWVVIRNSELLCGSIDKAIIGSGSKTSLFHALMRDFGPAAAASAMSRLAKLCARFLGDHGFSIGIPDVKPSISLSTKKQTLVEQCYVKCDSMINDYRTGNLPAQSGCTEEETLESNMLGELSEVRDRAGKLCISELPVTNSPLIMALCGSKGSNINISQMIACVGQQAVNGTRIPNGFISRTLPHFERDAKDPAAKGFVQNSFYTGMTGTEFFMHTMGGREGLVDTAVKTAETGYMQRRLVKALEDLSTQYDYTVRDGQGGVVQFVYGDDGLDPAGMEAKDRPVDFARVMMGVRATKPCKDEKSLSPSSIRAAVEELLHSDKFIGCSDLFLDEIRTFFFGKGGHLEQLSKVRVNVGLPPDEARPGDDEKLPDEKILVDKLNRTTPTQIKVFLDICVDKYLRAKIEPGTAVGALGAQSIGEPGTQMTLKTFHFAGVASMNVTLGVPRIKEIINASKTISTPIITALLVNDTDLKSARIVKGRIERTTLGQVCKHIKEVYKPGGCYLSVRLDSDALEALQLTVTADSVRRSILHTKNLKLKDKMVEVKNKHKVWIQPREISPQAMLYSLQTLKTKLANVIVSGIPSVERAVISDDTKSDGQKKYSILVEGYNLGLVMATPGVKGTHTTSNHIVEVMSCLGIEAARTTIMKEIQYTMTSHGMSIDTRHVMLLADLMSFKGDILGITRFGIEKMKESVLTLASFEKTADVLFDAAAHCRRDAIVGVSDSIIMGIPMPIGTGMFRLMHDMQRVSLQKRPLLLD
eukprot:TRINITY_DN6343_c0_g1_i1.p1 TRINITY_DN6343_c0_g1~~TRINITY_DN6343_c0_g1_i1.p1  ORF type:complete len:1395 (-),score=348.95 TRINITY_DN6343_c0_g1_i1:174-4358(-)